MGFNKAEISEILTKLHFNDNVNQHGFEYYQRVLTESKFLCLKFDEIENFNVSKLRPEVITAIRANLPNIKLTTHGIRVLLSKGLFTEYLLP